MPDLSPSEAVAVLRDALPGNPEHDGPVEAAARALLDQPLVKETPERRHILTGDLEWLEFAIADYVAKWGTNWTGQPYLGEFGPNIAGLPVAVANMAMTVIRKNIVGSWTEQVPVDVVSPLECSPGAAPDSEGAAQP